MFQLKRAIKKNNSADILASIDARMSAYKFGLHIGEGLNLKAYTVQYTL